MSKIGLLASSLFSNRMLINQQLGDDFCLISNWDEKNFECKYFAPLENLAHQNGKVIKIKHANDRWQQRKYPSVSKEIMDRYYSRPQKYNSAPQVWNRSIANSLIQHFGKSKKIEQKLKELKIDTLVCMNPYAVQEMLYAINAKRIGIKVITYIVSWDNVTTKTMIPYDPDAVLVWSDMLKQHVRTYYPFWDHIPVETVGALQYDHFADASLQVEKADFIANQGLNPNLPIFLYTLGSPNFLKEEFDILHKYCQSIITSGLIDKLNLIIRLHPDKSSEKFIDRSLLDHPNIHIDARFKSKDGTRFQSKDDIVEWVATFKHADLLINAGSTTLIDASVAGTPHINIASACEKGNEAFYEVIMNFQHLKELHQEGLVLNVYSIKQLVSMSKVFIEQDHFPDTTTALWKKVIQVEPGKSRETFLTKIKAIADA